MSGEKYGGSTHVSVFRKRNHFKYFPLVIKAIYCKGCKSYTTTFQMGVWVWNCLCGDHLSGGDFVGEEEEEGEKEEHQGGGSSGYCGRTV